MTLVAVAAIIGVSVQGAGANTFPNVVQNFVPFSQFQNAKTDVGPNGNESLIWDNLTGGYQGSVLWILNPQGQFVAAGDTMIPASIGNTLPVAKISNTAIHVYPSNNTQVAFALDVMMNTPRAFSTWTYNSQGNLIAAAGQFGPFLDTVIEDISFRDGVLIVKWGFFNEANAVWVLDEFGNIISSAGPFGPFPGALLGEVRYDSSAKTQLWQWLILSPTSHGLNTWTINSNGAIIASSSFGPF